MHRFNYRESVFASDERTRAKVCIPQSIRKIIHVHFATSIAWNSNAAAGMKQ
jgi:hypothetical protein